MTKTFLKMSIKFNSSPYPSFFFFKKKSGFSILATPCFLFGADREAEGRGTDALT